MRFLHGCVYLVVLMTGVSCQRQPPAVQSTLPQDDYPEWLSSYGLFQGDLAKQSPAPGLLAYELNTPLFSDYTLKYRFIKLPPGKAMKYQGDEPLEFPVGSIIAKTFAYPADQRRPEGQRRLLETRLLIREEQGWIGLPYVWNQEQTDARLKLTGGTVPSPWVHFDGKERTNSYIVPNANQCKGCHENKHVMQPIGPKPHHLNRDFIQGEGPANQLERWNQLGLLTGITTLTGVKKTPQWQDEEHYTLDQRARAWLDINCAHCHNPDGPARTSGLDLRWTQANPASWGVMKAPVAAGKGTGGRRYDIVPGKPDESILVYRLESTEPGIMMPELPRRMVDEEGVQLIRQWIASLPEFRQVD